MIEFGHKHFALATAAGAFLFPSMAHAGENASTLSLGALVGDSCTISSEDLAFGTLDISGTTQKDASATVTVACTTFKVFQVQIGLGFYDNLGQRRIYNGSSYINYNVYQDFARVTPWGDSAATERWGVAAAPSYKQDLEAYGRVTGLTPATAAGTYTDQLDISVNF